MNTWFEEKSPQLDVDGMNAFGIAISTRHGKAHELAELIMFAKEAAAANVNHLVIEAHYDSNSCCCTFTFSPALQRYSQQEEALRLAALKTIGQFEWFGCVEHGRGDPAR